MSDFELVKLNFTDSCFFQYTPANLHYLEKDSKNICIGGIYKGLACCVASAEHVNGDYYLRYIFTDPNVRCLGIATYVLAGLLGEVAKRGGTKVKAVFSKNMIENFQQFHDLIEKVGFSPYSIVGTGISIKLGDINYFEPYMFKNFEIFNSDEMTEELAEMFIYAMDNDPELPSFADTRNSVGIIDELSLFAFVDGKPAGVIIVEEGNYSLYVGGLYVFKEFRFKRIGYSLIGKAIQNAREIYHENTIICISAIDEKILKFCKNLSDKDNVIEEETEFISEYIF